MIKYTISIPENIRYFSEWKEFSLPDSPIILDKKLPGCGFTDYCITNSQDLILCSPRRILLLNKTEQHKNDVFYVINDISNFNFSKLSNDLISYITIRHTNCLPAKILVTYDSFHTIKDILSYNLILQDFQVIVDEFQSLFIDSNFKAVTEMKFIKSLSDIKRICYVSATPMMEKYLDQLDEFSSIPFYEVDWKFLSTSYYKNPKLTVCTCDSIYSTAKRIIDSYLSGKFERAYTRYGMVESKEAVFYVNSISNICNIIKRCKLSYVDCNILCAVTSDNIKRIEEKLGKNYKIGKVPLKGRHHKKFTFCTRTVYLGADFYSTNARSFIFSDANVGVLAIDISLDLPQILGRQRLDENPWKNEAEFYYKPMSGKKTLSKEEFDRRIKEKLEMSNNLIGAYYDSTEEHRKGLIKSYYIMAKYFKFRDNYISVDFNTNNKNRLSEARPVINKLVMISEQRTFDMQQLDYKDRISILENVERIAEVDSSLNDFFLSYNNQSTYYYKLKYLCEFSKTADRDIIDKILDRITEPHFKEYFNLIGPDRLREISYNITDIKKELNVMFFDSGLLKKEIEKVFIVGNKYHSATIKKELKNIYDLVGYMKKPTATDICHWYNVKEGIYVINNLKARGYLLISLKS